MNININFSVKQTKAYDLLNSEIIREVMYGGAKGGGKSVFLCYYALLYAKNVIDLCGIKVGKYPPVIGFLGRVRAVDFTKTTLVTWKKLIPEQIYTYNEQKKELVLFGKVMYHCGGLDDEEQIAKFNSAEYGFIGVDQAEEMSRDQAGMLRGTQNRSYINSVKLPAKILFTANPGECFLKEDFNPQNDDEIKVEPFRAFVQSLPQDNTFIDSKAYVDGLKDAWKHHPEILKAYVEGDWNSTKDGGYLITKAECRRLTELEVQSKPYGKRVVSVDPAWLGDKTDEIVIKVVSDTGVLETKGFYNQSTIVTASESVRLAKLYNASLIVIDAIGIGAGVVDQCRLLLRDDPTVEVIAINSSRSCEKDTDSERLANQRAEMWWKATEYLKENKFKLENDEELIKQLCAVKYEIKSGKIKIEDKKKIKESLKCSPDKADCLVQGIWMLEKASDYIPPSFREEYSKPISHFRRR